MSYRPPDQHGATIRLLVIAERLYDAVAARDAEFVRALLDSTAATSLPRQVREEALAIAALPAESHRVPMALLRFHHRLTELARSEDDAGDAFRSLDGEVALPLGEDADEEIAERSPRPDPAQLEIPFGRARWRLHRADRPQY